MSQAFVEVDHVDLAYDALGGNAIEDVSLSMREHEFIAMVGPSGCGKSTFMKLCSGLRPPTKGNVVVAGREVAGPLKIVGMAFQNATLLPWRTTLDNVLLPLEIVEPYRSSFKQKKSEYAERAKALLRSVGLEGYEDKFPWELSGGMQQRVSLCRALIHSPDILLLDVPFGALDAFTREELWAVLEELWLKRRFTMILVTHDLTEAALLADTVHVMSQRPGRIIYSRKVALPRPRSVYAPEFVDIIHDLRDRIGLARPARPA